MKHKVFVSYHHANDQMYKDDLDRLNAGHEIFFDYSVSAGDIDDALDDQAIRARIRDSYLRDSSVTIVLVGTETKKRKHVDWEIYSSMYNGVQNKQSGILVIMLPTTGCDCVNAPHGEEEKSTVHPGLSNWNSWTHSEYAEKFPHAPERIIDNLANPHAKISVVKWDSVARAADKLKYLIEIAHLHASTCEYDLSKPMRRSNS